MKDNKHPHHDLIVEWAKDTSKKWQRKDPDNEMFYDCFGSPSWSSESIYRLKPREFIKGHWYLCLISGNECICKYLDGRFVLGSNYYEESHIEVGKSLGEIKFGE